MGSESKIEQYKADCAEYGLEIAGRLHGLRLMSRQDKDGCQTVKVQCSGCYTWYDEELETAIVKVVSGAKYLCLSCDDNSKLSSRVTSVITLGSFVWLFD